VYRFKDRWGRAMLERFQDEETSTAVVVTTARLLTTGIDIPTLHTVVLFKPIRSIVEFKQIIGRGVQGVSARPGL
jgi:type I restriction enzyme R subunit